MSYASGELICDHCGKEFRTKTKRSNLQLHIKVVHSPNPPIRCTLCDAIFSDWRYLRAHTVQKHTKTLPYDCDQCGKRFVHKIHLLFHFSSVHWKLEPFHCGLCGARFGRQAGFQNYMDRLHSNEIYVCDECELNKTSKAYITKHISAIHQHQGASVCPICGAKYGQSSDLHKHKIRKHMGNGMIYKCDECSYETDQKASLVTHCNAVHMARRTHKCSYCKDVFAYANVLKYHMKKKHVLADSLFDCDMCEAKFWQRYHLAAIPIVECYFTVGRVGRNSDFPQPSTDTEPVFTITTTRN